MWLRGTCVLPQHLKGRDVLRVGLINTTTSFCRLYFKKFPVYSLDILLILLVKSSRCPIPSQSVADKVRNMLSSRVARSVRPSRERSASLASLPLDLQLPRTTSSFSRYPVARSPLASSFVRRESSNSEGKVKGQVIGIDLGRHKDLPSLHYAVHLCQT